jgi:hypothetical protein
VETIIRSRSDAVATVLGMGLSMYPNCLCPCNVGQYPNGLEGSRASATVSLGAQDRQNVVVPPVGVPGYAPFRGPPPGIGSLQAPSLHTRAVPHPFPPPHCLAPSSLAPPFLGSSTAEPLRPSEPTPSTSSGPPIPRSL